MASSSPMRLIRLVLEQLQIVDRFNVVHSAESEAQGKPHPAVYSSTMARLAVEPGSGRSAQFRWALSQSTSLVALVALASAWPALIALVAGLAATRSADAVAAWALDRSSLPDRLAGTALVRREPASEPAE